MDPYYRQPANQLRPAHRQERRSLPTAVLLLLVAIVGVVSGSVGTLATLELTRSDARTAASGPKTPIDGRVTRNEDGASATPEATNDPVAASPNGTDAVPADRDDAVLAAFDRVAPAVVLIGVRGGPGTAGGTGSGVIYHPDGWIVTNRHVVEGADTVVVQLPDGRQFDGRVVGRDTLTDLAIVKVEGGNLPAAAIGRSAGLRPGEPAIVIGNPLGRYENSVTTGVISGLGREIVAGGSSGDADSLSGLIQTDAAINPGNSGGALVNADGEVVGITTAVDGQAQGIGFAIPIDVARPIMDQARAGRPLARPWIGIYYRPLEPALAEQHGLAQDEGVLVAPPEGIDEPAVVPGSPAARAGVREGDVILAIDEARIDGRNTLASILLGYSPGDDLTLRVLRGGEQLELRLTLGTRPDRP